MQKFAIQIVDADTGQVIRFPAGARAGLERPLIEACTDAIVTSAVADAVAACTAVIVAKGVGYFKSEAQVAQAITEGLTETLPGRLTAAIDGGITETIRSLKHDVRYLVS